MKETKTIRKKWLNIRVSDAEYAKIESHFKTTTFASISEFARAILLKKPVIVKVRNQSLDEFLAELIQLKNELNAIGNNYNQAVHKLHMLDRTSEIKTWLTLNEPVRQSFLKNAEEIKSWMNKAYDLWPQK